jgi:hypothetical protein
LTKKTSLNKNKKIIIDDDFLINISAEIIDDKIAGYARIRSKMKVILISNIYKTTYIFRV